MTRFLLKAGEDVSLLTVNDRASVNAQIEPDVERHLIRVKPLFERFVVPRIGWSRLCRLVRQCDVVHLISHWGVLNALVYLAARHYEKPYVFCPAGALRIYGRSKALKRLYNFMIGTAIVRNANAVIAIVKDEIPDMVALGASRDRVIVIPNAVAPDDYTSNDCAGFRQRHGLRDVPFALVLGRLNPIKGSDLLVEAFGRAHASLGNRHLVFAGADEGFWINLTRIAERYGVRDRVHWIGLLGPEEKSNALHAADFLAIPSRHEAMSIVVLEAAAVGIPVLMTDRCGFDDVEATGGGKVVPATVEGLEAGLIEMANRADDFSVMGQRLREFCLGRYSWGAIVDRYRQLFRQVASQQPA